MLSPVKFREFLTPVTAERRTDVRNEKKEGEVKTDLFKLTFSDTMRQAPRTPPKTQQAFASTHMSGVRENENEEGKV